MNKKITQANIVVKALMLLTIAFFIHGSLVAQEYCIPTNNTNGSIYYISNVTTTGGSTNINNSSVTTNPEGYSDYTSMSVSVASGSSFSLSAQAYLFTYKWAIWIDWNQDGDFDDADESVYSYLETDNGLQNINTSIMVPLTALPGNTRMRIRLLRDWVTDELTPCALELYGEVEDYTVTVESTIDCDGVPSAGIINPTVNEVICGATVNLSLSEATIASGITYQWQYNNSGTWTDFGSSTLSLTSPSITETTQFRCVITCNNTGESNTTQAITISTESPVADLGNEHLLCFGNPVILNPGENVGANYSWSTGENTPTIEVTDPGTYSVTVVIGSCTAYDEVTVSEGLIPSVEGISAVNVASTTYNFAADNPQFVTSYSWDFGDGVGTSTLPAPQYSFTPGASPQTYTVTLIVNNNCGADTVTTMITVEPETGITDIEAANGMFKLYPNPAQQTVTLLNESGYKIQNITIINMLGQQLLAAPGEQNDRQIISLAGLSSGLYQVVIGLEQGIVVKKLEVIR